MQFSNSIEYAIHGLMYVAGAQGEKESSPRSASTREGRPVLLSDIAEAIRVPESYLRKVFLLLARQRLVSSQRGAQGGYSLARDAAEISLLDVVEAVEGSLPMYSCLKGRRACAPQLPCPVQEAFDRGRDLMAEELRRVSLRQLVDQVAQRPDGSRWLKVTA